jgi:hypothetical protein
MSFYIHRLRDLYTPGFSAEVATKLPNGNIRYRWVRAVCEPYTDRRLRAAWEVLRGRAFAFKWPKPGDIEDIVEGNER